MAQNSKKYLQLGILPHSQTFVDSECQPLIEETPIALAVGDRVRVKSKSESGSVYHVFTRGAIVLLDSSPNRGHSYPLSDLELQSPSVAHQKFDGQDQEDEGEVAHQKFDGQDQEDFWVELQYKTIKGKRYGPYRVQRWRDSSGRKRSKYLGKAKST